MAKEFVLLRLDKLEGLDLNVFEFDYDLTWAGFFLNSDEKIYGRYGGRDAASSEGRLSLPGLKFAMEAALAAHKSPPAKSLPAPGTRKPIFAEQYAAVRGRKGCVHCHNLYQFRHEDLTKVGKWRKEVAWVYPLPENAGFSLEVDMGNRIRSVTADSPASKAGLTAGDTLELLNGIPVASLLDAQYGLHRAPEKGRVPLSWQHNGAKMTGNLVLPDSWRRSDLSWRRSSMDLLSSFTVRGPDLGPAEKKALGLTETRLAFRVQKPILLQPQQAGIREDDIVLGINHQPLEMSAEQFNEYLRGYYQVGERVTFNILRGGKPLNLPATLR